ncbi:MAG: ATP-binding cassette domain-containing protein [Anaerolineae bacterium]|nr:ATP-binding cassette domain-containing protein [Anaerolineae bacterium]
MSEIIAALDKVSYKYPRSSDFVLKNIDLTIRKGEFFGVIGPTGAGKTTLCLTLNGIVPQFYGGRFFGHVHVAGLDTLDHPISLMASHVGAVFDDPETQLIATSVENEIAFALENLLVSREEIMARIPRALAAVRLEGTEKKHPAELSGGQKQRLAIAAALAVQPDLLVLDEPTSQLDPVGAQEVFATVRELNKELGMTIVMASHAAEEMAEYSDRVALLSHGELAALGGPDEIYSQIERLLQNDLRPPEVASTFYLIQKKGGPIPKIPVWMGEGVETLKKVQKTCEITPPRENWTARTYGGEPLLSLKDLKHVYPDGTEALHGVSLEIREGEYVLIIGQNGAGKSTLVKHFLNLLKPTSGSVKVGGVETSQMTVSDLARRIGYVAQNPDNQIFNATVGEEVAFALKGLGYAAEEVESRTAESLAAMGLSEAREMHPLSLPKGDRARVVIAAILAMKPEIIIFDEPTTGQDYRGAKYILEISRQLHQMGKTVIVITHHLYLMPEYAERVLVMGKGTLLMDAPIREAYHAVKLLQSTFLMPPQAVLLTQELEKLKGQPLPKLLTPDELAGCFRCNHSGRIP